MPFIAYGANLDKKFRGSSLALIERINDVIEDYARQGYSLTLRQVYYQMVARAIIPNNDRSYKNLGSLINDARLAGLIDWTAIEDRTRNLRARSRWASPGDIIKSAAYSYHIDHWKGQENYIEVWVEKDALSGIVGQICDELDVAYFSCRGYVSQSEMWVAAQRLIKIQEAGREVTLFHLGDHDPSGRDMSRDIEDRLTMFGVESRSFNFDRIALNMEQIELYNPPPNPTKLTDSRADGYIEEFGGECWELDALEPSVITALIREHVEPLREEELYETQKKREEEGRDELNEAASNWSALMKTWHNQK